MRLLVLLLACLANTCSVRRVQTATKREDSYTSSEKFKQFLSHGQVDSLRPLGMLLTVFQPGAAFNPACSNLCTGLHLYPRHARCGPAEASCSPECSCTGRRSALLTAALALLTPAGAAIGARPDPRIAGLQDKVRELGKEAANVNGTAEEHLAYLEYVGAKFENLLTPSAEVEVFVPYEPPPFKNHDEGDEYIKYIWVENAETGDVLNAKELGVQDQWNLFFGDGDEVRSRPPSMMARLPIGAEVNLCCYCTKHGVWKKKVKATQLRRQEETTKLI